MGIVLFIVASFLFVTLLPFGVVSTIIVISKQALHGKFFKTLFGELNRLAMSSAISLDQFGNTFFQYFFNYIMIKKEGYQFGNMDETISSVLGKNQRDKTLSINGKILCKILDTIDPDHCKKSINV